MGQNNAICVETCLGITNLGALSSFWALLNSHFGYLKSKIKKLFNRAQNGYRKVTKTNMDHGPIWYESK